MAEERSAFVGEIPANYDRYLGPLIFDSYAADLASRISVDGNGRVLETAAGTGLATRRIRDSLGPDVTVIATDLNADMLEAAERKFEASENIEFHTADAQALPFPDASFDAVGCQFSVMFFPDKQKALMEVARVLKPGGSFHFNVWDSLERNQFAECVANEVASVFPGDPPDFFRTPFGYFEIDRIRDLLQACGFGAIEISILPRISIAEEARDVARGFILGTPVRHQIQDRDPDALHAVLDRVEAAIGDQFGYRPASATMQAIAISAGRG